ncbi:DUF6906 family protein [Paenibacillus donghaensis]|uniref:DUF6906 family protein n=1 Tax=Paenibacillus donghaensis TaxID=414771 RepID=UPI0014715F0B|nr:hypothetical protein [Paenibacillus donghaensis]
MKNGKRPTRRQQETIAAAGLNPQNWLVSKDCATEFIVINRLTGKDRDLRGNV